MKQVENDLNGNKRFQFVGKLLSKLSDTTFQNCHQKNYKLANIEFVDVTGVKQVVSAVCYEANYTHEKADFQVGGTYLATATLTAQGPFIQLSHLTASADRASIEMFLSEAEVAEEAARAVETGAINS